MKELFQNQSSSTLQYLNKTFMPGKLIDQCEVASATEVKPNMCIIGYNSSEYRYNGNLSSNILKYKKYIRPLVSWNKLTNRMESPANISMSGKNSKTTKASSALDKKLFK